MAKKAKSITPPASMRNAVLGGKLGAGAAATAALSGLLGAGIASPQARYNPQRPTPFVPPKRKGSRQ